ncbi:MAG: ABC transporter substrate-binding protein [Cognatishimia sp.]|uniref:ABC transporter substrate-binding protein n=1 Tax=Cognatishimia sp. TaxID=2211648 RepID=UPI003B8CB1EE
MTRLDRRSLLKTGAAAGVLAASGLPLGAAARRGGVLRLGVGGARTSDSWDARTHAGQFMIMAGHGAVFDTLTQVAASGELVGELAERWEASADAKLWTFTLRKGIEFHNGKLFDADDVIASLRLHLDQTVRSPARGIVASISEMTAVETHKVQFRLAAPNADFPFLLADYHLCIYPSDNLGLALAQGIGTGLYKVIGFEPGKRAMLGRVQGHYKDGKEGWFDAVELIALNDPTTRARALMTGQVDAIDDFDLARKAELKAHKALRLSEVVGNQHLGFSMRADQAPFHDVNLRRALKYSIDRQAVVDQALFGHGRVAQDHPIGPVNQFMAMGADATAFDPDKARFYLRKAGVKQLSVTIPAEGQDHSAMGRLASAFATSAEVAGLSVANQDSHRDLTLQASVWSGRITEDWMFTMMAGDSPWNASHWENPHFQHLLLSARAELSTTKRQSLYKDMQTLMSDEGGALIPAFAHFADAHHDRLRHGAQVGNLYAQDSGRMIERWWFS